MKVVVAGGSGRSGARIVRRLIECGHDALAASRSTGVDTLSGAGVAEVLRGSDVVVDATSPPGDPLEFFMRSTQMLLAAGRDAGVRHHVVLSVVGADRMRGSAYMRAKVAQEDLVRQSGTPFSIVRATQFVDFLPTLVQAFTDGGVLRVPDARLQPVPIGDVVRRVADVAVNAPRNGVMEVGGAQAVTFAEALGPLTRLPVVIDASVTYFGAVLENDTLLPRAIG